MSDAWLCWSARSTNFSVNLYPLPSPSGLVTYSVNGDETNATGVRAQDQDLFVVASVNGVGDQDQPAFRELKYSENP